MEINEVLKNGITVFYVTKKFGFFSWRNPKRGLLKFTGLGVHLYDGKRLVEYWTNCKVLARFKMNGDFSKNWIKILDEDKGVYYISEYKYFHGLGAIFGGSKKLFGLIQRYIFVR